MLSPLIVPKQKAAEQGARANTGICHAACDVTGRSAPAPGVSHLDVIERMFGPGRDYGFDSFLVVLGDMDAAAIKG